jgi:cell shape-determining protein MreC
MKDILIKILGAFLITVGEFIACFSCYRLVNQQDKTKIEKLKKQVEELKKENEELEKKFNYEKLQAEYWYYYNVDDAC